MGVAGRGAVRNELAAGVVNARPGRSFRRMAPIGGDLSGKAWSGADAASAGASPRREHTGNCSQPVSSDVSGRAAAGCGYVGASMARMEPLASNGAAAAPVSRASDRGRLCAQTKTVTTSLAALSRLWGISGAGRVTDKGARMARWRGSALISGRGPIFTTGCRARRCWWLRAESRALGHRSRRARRWVPS